MQKVQALSQPIMIVTQAEWSTSLRTGSVEGIGLRIDSVSSRISVTGPHSSA